MSEIIQTENNAEEKQKKKPRHRKKQLFKSILQQMEFYFSDSNISKDRFLSQLIAQDQYVNLDVFLKCNKIRKLGCTLDDIRKAIAKSELLQLSDDCEKVARKLPLKIKNNVDDCTIYIENVPAEADHEWVKEIFSDIGDVVYVSIPKYKHNGLNKGFAFVEFENEAAADNALEYFESIGCKMSLEKDPEQLQSIATFEGNNDKVIDEIVKGEGNSETGENCSKENKEVKNKKRKFENVESEDEKNNEQVKGEHCEKKLKVEDSLVDNVDIDNTKSTDVKKKNKKKEKKKSQIIELGLQILSKKEWKKIRNRYLDLQRKKMKEFKQYLNKKRHDKSTYDEKEYNEQYPQESKEQIEETQYKKIEFTPGVIVKVILDEPCNDVKKMKSELKAINSNVKYVDIPLPAGSEEIFIRFNDNESAKEFCTQNFEGEKILLEHDEEESYWKKIENDRNVKLSKTSKKQRGRDRLLKKAEKEKANHVRFEEGE